MVDRRPADRDATHLAWKPLAALRELPLAMASDAPCELDDDVFIALWNPPVMIGLSPRRDAAEQARAHLQACLGMPAPEPGRTSRRGGERLVWSGLDQWLFIGESAPGESASGESADWSAGLDPDLVAMTDQTGARAIFRIGGRDAAEALAKGCFVDLHPRAFPQDAVAITAIAHIGVILWREGDGFALATPRSTASDVLHWLTESAAEFGLDWN
ncbi:MAG: sarcosine oxidase subunit gamma [Salinarimonas sp.]